MSAYATINPATGQRVAEYPLIGDAEVQEIIGRSYTTYTTFRSVPLSERTRLLQRAADLYRERSDELAAIITLEMGKPIAQSRGEVALVASIYEYYAQNAAKFLADEQLEIAGGGEALVRTEPIGPLLGVMPWNYPYYQVARFAAPNLALGNTIILKHARNCPQSALAIEKVFHDAGFPRDAYINAFVDSRQVADIIADPRVQGVSLTGSEKAGSAVGEVAGRHMKKYVLELGGSDPFIVLDDADIDQAVSAAVTGRVANGGQACTASKRFIVVDAVYQEFLGKFTASMAAIHAADPTDPDTFLGPLSSEATLEDLAELVDDAIAKGATVATGGHRLDGPGAYYPPTVLTGVTPQMRAYSEELFGPAAVVYRVPSADSAVDLANASPFGLAGTVFSDDLDKAKKLAERLDTGMVWINSTSRSAPDLPFGGVKRSGVGRELAKFGINEFANKKLIRTPQL
ncbi:MULTISPECIES: NAD-dependent succinate-semialdehyde dehydrogenase [unclassified Microbacterium]|jgi:succinate-semialdehyde dehydrogenase/glutarate-semialdehyde dehydrogenase|uniref:NAD-dependent succinate-semialdehyde dehydrogenase n=2 Tax=Microbacterium TaxID=33882 RepID=UPI00086D8198|nr:MULTISPECIES: NAD-dependent succinate-semialdehyde dehydrogenase [unclassified Microbacterium]ODT24664.1 MAG: succinate-semialdehyde dehydrogenase [Microbacterium sp. SCN 69-37]